MSLMKLAPESVRLRRVARAHAVGEFTQTEYRRARREVIENFDVAGTADDDTRPRSQQRPTPSGSAPSPGRQTDPVTPATTHRSRRGWLAWLAAALALVLASQLLAGQAEAQVPQERLEVPQQRSGVPAIRPVAERDPNPATSTRLTIAGVTIDLPGDLEVSEVDLQAVADAHIEDVRRRNRPAGHGFTPAELEEVGRLLNTLGVHEPGAALGDQDAADLFMLIQAQKDRRGMSVVELEEVAAAVQAHLREQGYFLAVAYLPAQDVADGRVTIRVLPGVLGEVTIDGADQRLARGFEDLLDRPVTEREINTRLYALNQSPGLTARASFVPGDRVGESRLQLELLERRSLRGDLSLDNHGDRHTGRQRLALAGDLINPTGRGDLLRLGLTAAIDPSNQLLGFAEYATPVGGRRQLRARLARNDFNTTGADQVYGDGWLFDGLLETHLFRSRLAGLSYELGVGRHSLDWDTSAGSVEQTVSLVSAGLSGRRVWDELKLATDFRLRAELGHIAGDPFAGQEEGFWNLGVDLFGWHPFDLEFLPGRQKLSVAFSGQLADSQLPSTRRFILGGAAGARGFERTIFLADSGFLLRTDLRTPLALGELSVFMDAGYGKGHNELESSWAHVANLGIGWDVRMGRHLLSSLSWAVPITAKGTGDLDDEGSQLFWSLRYAY